MIRICEKLVRGAQMKLGMKKQICKEQKMLKHILIAAFAGLLALNSAQAEEVTVTIEQTGEGSTPAEAQWDSVRKAQVQLASLLPRYVELSNVLTNHTIRTTITEHLAQFTGWEIVRSESRLEIPEQADPNLPVMRDPHGNPLGTRYHVANTIEFSFVPSHQIERARMLAQNQRLQERVDQLSQQSSRNITDLHSFAQWMESAQRVPSELMRDTLTSLQSIARLMHPGVLDDQQDSSMTLEDGLRLIGQSQGAAYEQNLRRIQDQLIGAAIREEYRQMREYMQAWSQSLPLFFARSRKVVGSEIIRVAPPGTFGADLIFDPQGPYIQRYYRATLSDPGMAPMRLNDNQPTERITLYLASKNSAHIRELSEKWIEMLPNSVRLNWLPIPPYYGGAAGGAHNISHSNTTHDPAIYLRWTLAPTTTAKRFSWAPEGMIPASGHGFTGRTQVLQYGHTRSPRPSDEVMNTRMVARGANDAEIRSPSAFRFPIRVRLQGQTHNIAQPSASANPVPDVFAAGFWDAPPVMMTILFPQARQYMDIPLSGFKYLITATEIELFLQDPDFTEQRASQRAEAMQVEFWWPGRENQYPHPAHGTGYERIGGMATYPTLPHNVSDAGFAGFAEWIDRYRDELLGQVRQSTIRHTANNAEPGVIRERRRMLSVMLGREHEYFNKLARDNGWPAMLPPTQATAEHLPSSGVPSPTGHILIHYGADLVADMHGIPGLFGAEQEDRALKSPQEVQGCVMLDVYHYRHVSCQEYFDNYNPAARQTQPLPFRRIMLERR